MVSSKNKVRKFSIENIKTAERDTLERALSTCCLFLIGHLMWFWRQRWSAETSIIVLRSSVDDLFESEIERQNGRNVLYFYKCLFFFLALSRSLLAYVVYLLLHPRTHTGYEECVFVLSTSVEFRYISFFSRPYFIYFLPSDESTCCWMLMHY